MSLSNILLPDNAHRQAEARALETSQESKTDSRSKKKVIKTVKIKIDDGTISGSEIHDKTKTLPFELTFDLKYVNNYRVTSVSEMLKLLEPYRTIITSKKGKLCSERLIVYFVHCRRELEYIQSKEKMDLRGLTPRDGCMYILVECHGLINRSIKLKSGNGLTDSMLEGVFIRAPAGAICRQHGMPQIYDNSVKCFFDGHDFEIPLTDDWIIPENITYRFMTKTCDYHFHSQGTPRTQATKLRNRAMLTLPRSETLLPGQLRTIPEVISSSDNYSQATQTIEHTPSQERQNSMHIGGTVKRKRRKRKTRKR
jgi:hypothetical protein